MLITDATYKHAIALARYIRKDLQNIHLTGYSVHGALIPKLYGCFDEVVSGEPLETVIDRGFDQVIPVGGNSTVIVACLRPDLAVLPSMTVLDRVYSKRLCLEIACRLGVPIPKTQAITCVTQLRLDEVSFPCVLKPDHELAPSKEVVYCRGPEELMKRAERMLTELRKGGNGLLVQEYIEGPGHGFFALTKDGVPYRLFMHRRLREFPSSGGISTAAASFYSRRLEDLGRRLLAELKWNGVAMVEFKYDLRRQDFVLMEINGKFWGSLELALRAGVNFGADLIRMYRNEPIEPDFNFDRNIRFYWPFDGDLNTLLRTHKLISGVKEYFQPGAATNLGQSKFADCLRFTWMVRNLPRSTPR